MASDLESSIREAAARVAEYVRDAATLVVETRYLVVGPNEAGDFAQAKPAARTEIRLDSDSFGIVPMVKNERGGLDVDTALNEVHMKNVEAAIRYRQEMLSALSGLLQARLR